MAKSELATRLQQATVAAMKAKDRERLQVLRMLQSAVKQVEVDTRREPDDETVVGILRGYAKKVKDTRQGALDAGREELAAAADAELAIVQEFLPAELDDAALEAHARAAIEETGAQSLKDMGRVMKATLARTAGQADGSRVSAVVKRLLTG